MSDENKETAPGKGAKSVNMDAATLAQIISAAVSAGVSEAVAAMRKEDEVEIPPVDPKEVQSEMETQLAEERYLITISKGEKGCVDPVPIGVNGITRTVKRGSYAVITASMLEVLRNSVEVHIDPDSKEPFEVQCYPYTVIKELTDEEREIPAADLEAKYGRNGSFARH